MKKIVIIKESGLYDHERGVIAKYARKLVRAEVVRPKDMVYARIDHADIIIYFDSSEAYFYSHVCINTQMVIHAAQMGEKGIKTLLVTRNAKPTTYEGNIYRVWSISSNSIVEKGTISEASYRYKTYERVKDKERGVGKTFESLDWAEFQRRFLVEKRKK